MALLLAAAACTAPRENSVHRAARERRVDRLQAVREQQAREQRRLEAAIDSDREATQRLGDEASAFASRRRDVEFAWSVASKELRDRQAELETLRGQVAAAAEPLEHLRALRADVELHELKARALQEQRDRLQQQVAAAEAEVHELEKSLSPRLDELKQRLERMRVADAQAKALQALLASLAPPADPAPGAAAPAAGAAPAGQPAAGAPATPPAGGK